MSATIHPLPSLNLAGALGSLAHPECVERLLEKSKGPEFTIQKATLRAEAAHGNGRTNESVAVWSKALRLSNRNPQMRQIIAVLAERCGYQQVSLDA